MFEFSPPLLRSFLQCRVSFFFLVGLKYLTCSVALRGSRAFGATTLTAASSPFFTDPLPLARAGGAPCLAVRRSRMSLTRVTGQCSLLKGRIIAITLPELPAGYARDQELLLQIPVQVKLRARSAEAPEEGRPPEVPERGWPAHQEAEGPAACD